MSKRGSVHLKLDPDLNRLGKKKELRQDLSAVVQIARTLWLANDEALGLERLSYLETDDDGTHRFGEHVRFELENFLELPHPPRTEESDGKVEVEEADIEGLAYDGGYLWLVGSHSLKRKKAKSDRTPEENAERLGTVSAEGNRYLLARIPVDAAGDHPVLARSLDGEGGRRVAARLRGTAAGNDLTRILSADPHLAPFLSIPGKDNGFDVEGLAVSGNRVFLGLRGPVLRGWAIVLEIRVVADEGNPSELRLARLDAEGLPYRKHFLRLDGLGVRDLLIRGDDLLVLAGPTMDLDGPVRIYRWKGGAAPEGASVVPRDSLRSADVPYGEGEDHAEGMALFQAKEGGKDALLLVYDSAAKSRLTGKAGVTADLLAPDWE